MNAILVPAVQSEEAPPDAVLTLPEVAALLKVSLRTVARLAVKGRRGGIPAFRVGRSVRVQRTALDRWIAAQRSAAA